MIPLEGVKVTPIGVSVPGDGPPAPVPPEMAHRISAGAFVEHDGRLLLVRHFRPDRYDFWVAPGGGVIGTESLAAAAAREVHEETGLAVEPDRLVYVEEFHNPHMRYCKFWFTARWCGGTLSVDQPGATGEHIVEAAWHTRAEVARLAVFPSVLQGDYWTDRAAGFPQVRYLGLRAMSVW